MSLISVFEIAGAAASHSTPVDVTAVLFQLSNESFAEIWVRLIQPEDVQLVQLYSHCVVAPTWLNETSLVWTIYKY